MNRWSWVRATRGERVVWPRICGLTLCHLKVRRTKISERRVGFAVCRFIFNGFPWFLVFFVSLHAFHSVRKMVKSTFLSTTLNITDPKKTKHFATSFATCMSGGGVPGRHARRRVIYRCHLSCQAQGFPRNGGKKTKWKHLCNEWQMFTY